MMGWDRSCDRVQVFVSFQKKRSIRTFLLCMRWIRYYIFAQRNFPLFDNSFGGYLYFTFRNCRKTNYSKSRGWALKPQPFGKCKDGITFKRSNLHTKGLKSWQLAKCGAVSSWSHSLDIFNDDDTTSDAGCHFINVNQWIQEVFFYKLPHAVRSVGFECFRKAFLDVGCFIVLANTQNGIWDLSQILFWVNGATTKTAIVLCKRT